MLKSLKIHNIALITDCEINFEKGLNVLSGETGSGKSVILESVNFVLGQKADKAMIRHGQDECWALCVFDISNLPQVKKELLEVGLEEDDQVIIKRTFNQNGKGTIKVNGETVTASMLRKITSLLVDVHGQSDHFVLLKESAQLETLDQLSFDSVSPIKERIEGLIYKIREIENSLKLFGGSDSDRAKRIDYLDYSIKEIENSAIYVGEDEELSEKRKKLQNIEKIYSALNVVYESINGENGVSDLLLTSCRAISSISHLSDDYEKLSEELESCLDKIQNVSSQALGGLEEEFDVSEADQIERRIEEISRLKLKYGRDIQTILAEQEKMQKELDLISSSAKQIENLNNERLLLMNNLEKEYELLSLERQKVSKNMSDKLEYRLHELAMKNAKFSVEFEKLDSSQLLSVNGYDKITFMFSANAGEPLKPLSKVISGGELSRLMLAMKSVNEGIKDAQTYIFDEIDSGISGVTASVVGENFARIAQKNQIIAISHLPQIVAMSDSSLLIKKTDDGVTTTTQVFPMSEEEKLFEVVRLVGGDENSLSAQTHAREIIEKCNSFKNSLRK